MRIQSLLTSSRFAFLALAFTFVLLGAVYRVGDAKAAPDEPAVDDTSAAIAADGNYTISGPYTHENLTVFLIHGAERLKGNVLTLQEAMARKKVKVYETGDVNELAVENFGNEDVFIQSGEIVKGGQQDRVIGVDMILSAKSGRVPIESFCVEHGRWSGRGGEDVKAFSGSSASLNSKDLKMAARYTKDQSSVWNAVAKAQDKLAVSVGATVTDSRSESSLQLTLEGPALKKNVDKYVATLRNIAAGKKDVIGYAFAVNGTINSADVYGSNRLFGKLWPKMLHAAAVEAVSERGATPAEEPAKVEDVNAVLSDAEKGKGAYRESAGEARGYSFESEKNVLFETRKGDSDDWVHRSYMTK